MAEDGTQQNNMPNHHKAMIQACEAGNLEILKQLFENHNIKQGSEHVRVKYVRQDSASDKIEWKQIPPPADGPPATKWLFEAAISHHQPILLDYLLQTYPPKGNEKPLADSLLGCHDPNIIELVKVVQAHSSYALEFEYQMNDEELLTTAIIKDNMPLAMALVDVGVHPNSSGRSFAGNIGYALVFKRPLELICNMIRHGGYVSGNTLVDLIKYKRTDVMHWLLLPQNKYFVKQKFDTRWHTEEKILNEARETGNEDIVASMEVILQLWKTTPMLEDLIQRHKEKEEERNKNKSKNKTASPNAKNSESSHECAGESDERKGSNGIKENWVWDNPLISWCSFNAIKEMWFGGAGKTGETQSDNMSSVQGSSKTNSK